MMGIGVTGSLSLVLGSLPLPRKFHKYILLSVVFMNLGCHSYQKAYFQACRDGDYLKVQQCIDRIDIEQRDRRGRTGLMIAAISGHEDVVRQLLENNGRPELQDELGRDVLDYAVASEKPAIISLIVTALANGNDNAAKERALSSLSSRGYHEMVKELLLKGVDPDVKDQHGWTPLMRAAWRGHEQVCETLLDCGANANVSSEGDIHTWPIMIASRAGHAEIVKLLSEHNADITVRDHEGRSSLFHAIEQNNIEVAQALLELGYDPNEKFEAIPILFHAISDNRLDIARLMLEYGAKPVFEMEGIEIPLDTVLKKVKASLVEEDQELALIQNELETIAAFLTRELDANGGSEEVKHPENQTENE